MVEPQTPGFPDHAKPRLETQGVSPKALMPTIVMGLLGVVAAVLNGVQDNPSMLGGLPTWLQSAILLLIPPALTYVSAYQAPPGTVVEKRS